MKCKCGNTESYFQFNKKDVCRECYHSLMKNKNIEFFDGLKARNFVNIEGIDSKGKCHTPDEEHYILLTDGLVIYSTIAHWDNQQYHPNSVVKRWFFDEFNFEELDKIINT